MKKSAPPSLTPKWRKLLKQIPHYDAISTAGKAVFDQHAAQEVLDFFPTCLKFIEGSVANQPFVLEPWEQAILANLFGWKRPDGTRRYREAFIFVPRKNNKTPLLSGIVLYVLFCDPEKGQQLYSAASDREQASLVYRHAKGMVLSEPELASRCQIYATSRSIVREATNSSYKVLSSDSITKHGLNSNLVVVDELHAQPNRELVDTLITGTASRKQPLVIYITTSDFDRPSICNEKYDYASKVRDGIIEDASFLPVIYEASIDADWTDPKVWAHANPNLGKSVSIEYLERECKRAQETPSYQNTFKRLHLNIKTAQDVQWISIEHWDQCEDLSLYIDDYEGESCFAGLDLASVSDLCAMVLYFPIPRAVFSWFWIPEESANLRLQRARVPYPSWIEQGFITATEGNVTDYDVIRRDITQLSTRFHIQELAIDRWNSTQLQNQLTQDGIDVVPYSQAFSSMSPPAKELERLLVSHELLHNVNPVMRWCLSNVMIETDADGNIKPSKRKSTEKIDGVIALVMALGRALAQPMIKVQTSIYETRGLLRV